MSDVFIRDIDEEVKKTLKEIAKKEKISVSELSRSILSNYVYTNQNADIESKFTNFTEDIINLYQIDREEMILSMERMENLISVQEEMLSQILNVLNAIGR